MNKEEIQNISFQLISYAGDACSCFMQAVTKAKEGKCEEADELLSSGNEQLVKAHKAQTDLLVTEAQGNDLEFSVLLIHAQDHLMTTIMYERIAKEFISLYKERGE